MPASGETDAIECNLRQKPFGLYDLANQTERRPNKIIPLVPMLAPKIRIPAGLGGRAELNKQTDGNSNCALFSVLKLLIIRSDENCVKFSKMSIRKFMKARSNIYVCIYPSTNHARPRHPG